MLPRQRHIDKTVNSWVGKAIHRYAMIQNGDRIAVALSGGKDSLTLLWTLAERQKRVLVKYQLQPLYIDPGFGGGFGERLADTCRQWGLTLHRERTDHGIAAHSAINRENPCFLCARLRRRRLFELAAELDCNKLALGHTKDDIIETFFLNICYAGEISTMVPVQALFNGRCTVVRPLAMIDEEHIRRFAEARRFPVFANPCPSSGRTKRSEIKTMLDRLYRTNPKIKGNIYRAMSHVRPDYLLK